MRLARLQPAWPTLFAAITTLMALHWSSHWSSKALGLAYFGLQVGLMICEAVCSPGDAYGFEADDE